LISHKTVAQTRPKVGQLTQTNAHRVTLACILFCATLLMVPQAQAGERDIPGSLLSYRDSLLKSRDYLMDQRYYLEQDLSTTDSLLNRIRYNLNSPDYNMRIIAQDNCFYARQRYDSLLRARSSIDKSLRDNNADLIDVEAKIKFYACQN